MSDDRTLAPMALDTILPMIRTLHALQERAGAKERAAERGDAGGVEEYHSAAMLEERIRHVVEGRARAQQRLADLQTQTSQWQQRRDDAAAELETIAGQIAAQAPLAAAQLMPLTRG